MASEIDDSQIRSIYWDLHEKHGVSADKILINPTLRTQFLDRIRHVLGDVDENALLGRLL